jgi:15-cis-phytoene desaturase
MNRFLNEDDGLQMGFLDGNQPDRLCKPMKDYIEEREGEVRINAAVKEIVTNDDGSVKHLLMRSGEKIVADEYISAMPVDIMKRFVPKAWSTMPYFKQMENLEGIPVINLHMWFDTKLKGVDHLCFSRSPLLSVYADMSTTCKEYYDEEKSMLELVFAPCSPIAGGKTNWISKSDEEIIAATMIELERLFRPGIAAYTERGVLTTAYFNNLAFEPSAATSNGNNLSNSIIVAAIISSSDLLIQLVLPPAIGEHGANTNSNMDFSSS